MRAPYTIGFIQASPLSMPATSVLLACFEKRPCLRSNNAIRSSIQVGLWLAGHLSSRITLPGSYSPVA